MAKSSINFKPVKGNSEAHNLRETPLDYTLGADLTATNESWVDGKIRPRQADIEAYCRRVSGRKMNKNATPIREAVVNLNANHSLADCRRLGDALRDKFKIDCFQIHIHRDEGKDRENRNYHAHMVFDWQNKESGKMLRLNKIAMSQIQTLVADTLEMERGTEGSKAVRLEAQAYKATAERKTQEAARDKAMAESKVIGIEVAELKRKKQSLLAEIDRWYRTRLVILKKKLHDLKTALTAKKALSKEQRAIALLKEHQPETQGEALKILAQNFLRSNGKFLHDALAGYEKDTGLALLKQPVIARARSDPSEKRPKVTKTVDFGIGD